MEISEGNAVITAKPGEIVKVEADPKLGSPLFGIVVTRNGKKKVAKLPLIVEEDWGGAEVVYFFSKKGFEAYMDSFAHLMELAIKKYDQSFKLAGFVIKDNEVRIDFYTSGKQFTRKQAEEIIKLAQSLKEVATINELQVKKEDVISQLKSSGEDLLAELATHLSKPKLIKIGEIFSVCDSDYHLPNFSTINKIELLNLSTSHWMGREDSLVLTSIHVMAFPTNQDEELFKKRLEESERRDHINLGKEMDIFLSSPIIGAGIALWAPNGAIMRRVLDEYIVKLHLKRGYQLVSTPHIATTDLFKISGHLDHYRQNMFLFELEGKEYAIKPMNCPFHIMILKRRKWSYKELPIRYFEMGNVYRYERAGTLHGLTRVRGFTIDDAHIFLREDQIEQEISNILKLIKEIYGTMGLKDYRFILSLRDPEDKKSYMGGEEIWNKAEAALEKALRDLGISYTKSVGDAAFYGPKIDVVFTDSLGREWQCATIQLDFNLPERFDLKYMDKDNKEKRMVIIHRAILGSVERFIGILLEQYAGRLPLWLAPVQVVILPVEESSQEQISRASEVYNLLVDNDVRTVILKEGRLNARMRDARALRAPIIVVVGDKEVQTGSLSVTKITYGEDEERRFKPIEEKLEFSSPHELIKWIKETIRLQTNGILA